MAYDLELATRVWLMLQGKQGVEEKKMFGGVGYMIQGNMACGVNGDELIVRVGPYDYEDALNQSHTREFDFTGRPMKGWVKVTPEGCATDEQLKRWVQKGVEFALSLPPK